ncbi:MAG: TonB-dependent siderophore receptor [Rhodovulum sulfidophilum]|uniref:TonB-dependent siderophore receptor n=1 Tax=Rhodovulum sulfidophilum TaxID=35806 RepID=A0A2W5PTE4_RHOSU|nr:MAG: TonB-dependent siderophore receptor [Rhodovulum sulfidophilum]
MLGGALFVAPAGAYAQDAGEPDLETESAGEGADEPFRLSPILVNATAAADDDRFSIVARELWVGGKVATSILDTPASVSVITGKEIEERNAKTVEQVLQYTPGIITDYYGTDDRNDYYSVRGFQASTYRDGLTLGTMRGVREEPYAYERVEVLKGANSTLFGASDPGGSINFVTKTPIFERFGSGYAQVGNYDHYELGFDMGDVVNPEGTLAYRITGKAQDSALEYDHSRDDAAFLMGGLTWAPTDVTSLTFALDYLKRNGTPNSGGYPMDREYDRNLFFGQTGFNYHDVERTTASLMFQHAFEGGLSLTANLRYSDLEDNYGYVYLSDYLGRVGDIIPRFGISSDTTAKETIGNVIAQYDASFDVVDSVTLVGIEYRDASTTALSSYGLADPLDLSNPNIHGRPTDLAVYADDNGDYTTKSVFFQQNLSFYDRAILTFGARQDWMDLSATSFGVSASDDFSESSIRAAFTYKVTEEVSAYASYVESVAPPQIGVTPERGDQYEVGVKYEPAGYNALITAAVFDLTRDDVTIAVVQDDGTIVRQVVGEMRSRGLEIEGKAELFDNFNVVAGYTYLDTDVVEGTLRDGTSIAGNQFASVPRDMASVWGYYTFPGAGARGDISLGLGARYIGSYYFNAENSTGKSEAATLFDAALGYSVTENAQLTVNVSNLFDKQYVVGRGTADYYNPARTIMAGLTYNW